MSFNPLKEKGTPIDKQIHDWTTLNVQPYHKLEVAPYTRARVILMNGIEVESAIFLHQFHRHTPDIPLRQQLALARRVEQQQQKMVNWLIPADESTLEVTIGYEQLAVDLTADMARTEPDPYVKQVLEFALLEDFDHLYRYANLLDMDKGIRAEDIVKGLTEITPGRPTIVEHRHPFDDVRRPGNKKADMLTKLHVQTITAAEQQTMNFYMTVGNRYPSLLGRGLYLEIGQIEEQHVTHYGSLVDPTATWFEMLALHDYNEAYMYWSCAESETDPRIKEIWTRHLEDEIGHLQVDRLLLQKYEQRDIEELFPASGFPMPTTLHENREYVRGVLQSQTGLTADGIEFVAVERLPENHRLFAYQELVNNGGGMVRTRDVIQQHIDKQGQDYRMESLGPHPIKELQPRNHLPESVAGYSLMAGAPV